MSEILASAFAGFLALAGVWLGQHLQRKDGVASRKQAYDLLMREKAEELIAISALIRGTTARKTKNALENFEEMDGLGGFEMIHRAEALIVLYFPQAMPILQKYKDGLAKALNTNSSPKPAVSDIARAAGSSSVEFADEIRSFIVKISFDIVPKQPS